MVPALILFIIEKLERARKMSVPHDYTNLQPWSPANPAQKVLSTFRTHPEKNLQVHKNSS